MKRYPLGGPQLLVYDKEQDDAFINDRVIKYWFVIRRDNSKFSDEVLLDKKQAAKLVEILQRSL